MQAADYGIRPGMVGTASVLVTRENTASNFGSGGVDVLATPFMVGLMELAARNAVESILPAGYTTVGTMVSTTHLAATPIGMRATATATLTEVDGRKLVFRIEAHDEREKIGEGLHERFIIDFRRFMERAANKVGHR